MAKVTLETLIEARKKGWSDKVIAEKCGVTKQAVLHMRKKFGVARTEPEAEPKEPTE